MRGSIRFVLGLIITMSAVGGVDNASDAELFACIAAAAIGLLIMASGTRALQRV